MSNNETYTVLWETDTPFNNQYTISLNDSIDNYNEIICYGSANRGGNDRVNVKTTYPVVSGTIHLVGPYTLNTWQSTNSYMLNNGTQMYLSGTSGFIDVSYYWGMQNGGTGFEANRYTTARNADVHPYKIVGVKNKLTDKIWETTGNTYETNITLDEPITHFNKVLIYSSGTEDAANGVHLAKNVYTVQPQTVNGCDTWGYSPWELNYKCNYLLGCSLKLSGNSGHIGSAYFWGIGNNNATWAAGKWTGTAAPRMLQPYIIYGLDRKPTYNVNLLQTEGGTISVSPNKGYEFDIATLTNTTANEDYKFSSYNITGATLTGDQFQFETSDVKVQGNFEHNKTLTLINGDHAVLSADKDKGFIGDVVTVTGTMDEGWYLTGFNTTGATMTGNKFAFAGEDVTVEGLYTDEGFPVVYEAENGVHLAGDPIAIPGQGVTLTTSYDTYYRTNGYDITGGYIENGMLYATAACTARLKSKLNTFTASGGWEKGSDVTVTGGNGSTGTAAIAAKYATVSYHTSNVPTAWYNTSNRWKVTSTVSAYKITLNPTISMSARAGHTNSKNGYWLTGVCLLGSTQTQSQGQVSTHSTAGKIIQYSKSFTASNTGVNYGVSGLMKATGGSYNDYYGAHSFNSTGKYVAARTTGTWVATGIAQ